MIKPFVIAVSDYHEFKEGIKFFDAAGIEMEFKEIGCGMSPYWKGPHAGYHAVFFEKKDRKKGVAWAETMERRLWGEPEGTNA